MFLNYILHYFSVSTLLAETRYVKTTPLILQMYLASKQCSINTIHSFYTCFNHSLEFNTKILFAIQKFIFIELTNYLQNSLEIEIEERIDMI